MPKWHNVLARHSARRDGAKGPIPRQAAILVLLLAAAGCSAPPDPRRTNFEIVGKEATAKYDPKSGRLTKLDVDTNKNGRMESFSYWDGPRLIRIEVDKDEDGRIDRWEHYDDQNQMTRVGSSSKDDQVEDTWTYPDAKGFLARVDTDTNRDGSVDKRETFVPRADQPDGRVLQLVELDIDQAGNPGRRLYYRADGTFDRVETVPPGLVRP